MPNSAGPPFQSSGGKDGKGCIIYIEAQKDEKIKDHHKWIYSSLKLH
jgi:hypothetical protein